MKVALNRNLTPLEIHVDCKEIIHMLEHDHPSYANILCDCRELLDLPGNLPIHHSFREQNQVADGLAKGGAMMKEANSYVLLEVPPLFVSTKIEADKVGTLFFRLKRPSVISDNCNSTNIIPPPPNIDSGQCGLPLPCTNAY